MSKRNNNLADLRNWRGAYWFALVPIVWLQLSLAVHQFDHVADYVEDSCHVCIQLDRLDDGMVDHAVSTAPLLVADTPVGLAPTTVASRTFIRGFDSRAPPQL